MPGVLGGAPSAAFPRPTAPARSISRLSARARRYFCFSMGSVGHVGDSASAKRVSTADSSVAASRIPVTGSNLPLTRHMPSSSTQLDSAVDRRCRSSRATPSSARIRDTSSRRRLAKSGTVATAATSTRLATLSKRTTDSLSSRCFAARLNTSTWLPLMRPASSAAAISGAASSVRVRSRIRLASFKVPPAASATSFSGNDEPAAMRRAKLASAESKNDRKTRTSASPACSSTMVALALDCRWVTRSNCSIAPAVPMSSTIEMGCHRVFCSGAGRC